MGKQRDQKRYPEFHATQQLREVHRAAEIYMQATGNRVVFDALQAALDEVEKWEGPNSYSKCKECGCRIPKGRNYCGLDCAETAGAIPPK